MRGLLLLLIAMPSLGRAADAVVISDTVSDVAVTIYRDPYRDSGMMNAGWPGGYGLITETRTVTLPEGDSVIRFENVAEGLLPETAIITGLPNGVREKNRDARLISPAGLVDAYLKRRVLIRRTDPATGKAREELAIIRSGPDGGVILQTEQGVEALQCSGLPERMIYNGIPADLSAKPTLSIRTRSDRPVTVKIQLTYMAQGFDWSANYVGNIAPQGGTMGLFAWLTVANGGQQSFRDARLQVIAGKPNKRPNNPPPPPPATALTLQCWPMDNTSTHPAEYFTPLPLPPGDDLSRYNEVGRNAPGSFETKKQRKAREKRERYAAEGEDLSEVIVTASRRGSGGYSGRRPKLMQGAPMAVSVMSADVLMPAPPPPPPPPPVMAENVVIAQGAKAGVEDLGDLKLYRVPMPVTVAAQSQKQVAMISQPAVGFVKVYTINVDSGGLMPRAANSVLRARNVQSEGLGLPLPAGSVAVFEPGRRRTMLVGEYPLGDLAIGQDVEIGMGYSTDVNWTVRRVDEKDHKQGWRVDITNARDAPVMAEVIIPYDLEKKPAGLERGNGGWKLPVTVEGNGSASVTYILKTDVTN